MYEKIIDIPKYKVKIPIEGNKFDEFEGEYYFIDFTNITRVNCACIAHEKENKPNYRDLLMKMLSSKILELSIEARSDLRRLLSASCQSTTSLVGLQSDTNIMAGV